jgi:hypothetical protein
MLLAAVGMVLMTQLTLGANYWSAIVPGLLLVGFGIGLVFGVAMNVGTAGATESDAGVASAMVNTSQQIGGAIGTALLNSLAASATARYALHRSGTALVRNHAALHGDIVAFVVVVGVLAVAAVVTLLVYPNGKVEIEPDADRVAFA